MSRKPTDRLLRMLADVADKGAGAVKAKADERERQAAGLPPAGWFPCPGDSTQLRYWDGSSWTDHYAPAVSPQQVAQQSESSPALSGIVHASPATPRPVAKAAGRPQTGEPTLADVVAQMSLEPPRGPLDEQVEVAGETYHVKGIKRVFAEVGQPITRSGTTVEDLQCILVPEPWNPHDPNAIAVLVGSHQVGHLPAEIAEDYAPNLNQLASRGRLATGTARIWAKSDSGVVRARVTLCIDEAHLYAT